MLRNPLYVHGPQPGNIPANLNFGDYIIKRLWGHGDKIALINAATDEVLTYRQLAQEAMNVAISLSHIGVRKGETVAICSENRKEFWGAVIGSICVGAVITTVNPLYTETELKHVLGITKPKYMFTTPVIYNNKVKIFKSLTYLKKIILFGDDRKTKILYKDLAFPDGNSEKIFENNKLKRNVRYDEFEPVDVEGQNDVVVVMYSSGTTGLPKGVMLTHLNILTSCISVSTTINADSMGFYINPWFHVMGLVGGFVGQSVGRTVVYLPRFDLDLYLKTIEKYKIEFIYVVPPVLVAAVKSKATYDLSSVRTIYSGAAPLQSDTLSIVKTKFPNVEVVLQGYGMTEVTLGVIRAAYDEAATFKPGTVGKVVAGHVVKVVDTETRKVLGPNQSGEICFKGSLVMKGYVGKDKKDDFDEEGFFKSGDIGYYDEHHHFYIVDRLKELIKYKAFQVPPAEIESLLLQHEGIRDAGVVGLPNREAGELPLAFVVRQPGSKVTEKEIQDYIAEKLSNPKRLRGGVRFVNEIPKNPSGKILRKSLRNMIKQKSNL